MKANQDVTLRITTETDGDSGVKTLADEIDRLAESGGELAPKFRELAEEMRKIEQTQGLVESFAKLKQETGAAAVALEAAQTKAQALGREFAATENPSRALTNEFAKSRKEVQAAQQALQAKQLALQKMRGDLKTAGIDTASLAEAERKLRAELVQMEERGQIAVQVLGEMGAEAQEAGERVEDLGVATESAGSALSRAVANFTAGAAAIAGLHETFGPAIEKSIEFADSMDEISTLLEDTSAIPRLSADVRALSREFGGDVQDNAKALYDIISAGNTDSAAAINVLTAANKLAIGGVTEVSVAADGLTTALNAYQLGAARASDVSDAFFVAVRAGKTTVGELATNLGKVAPIAAQTGVELDQLLAAVAALTTAGGTTAERMTQLRAVLTAIIKPSKEAADLATEIGLQYNLAALKAQGFAGFLDSVRKATGGSAEQMAVLLGSTEAVQAVMALTGTQAQTFAGILEQMTSRAGAAETAFGKMMGGADTDIDRFNAALHDAQIALGDAVLALTPLLNVATDTLNVFNELPEGIRRTIAALGAVAVGAPVVLFALRSFVAAWAALRSAMLIGPVAASASAALAGTATVATSSAVAMKTAGRAALFLSRSLKLLAGPLGIALIAFELLIPALTDTGDAADKAAAGTDGLADGLAEGAKKITEAANEIDAAQQKRLTAEQAFSQRIAAVKSEETARIKETLESQVKAYREATERITAAVKARDAAERRVAALAQSNAEFQASIGKKNAPGGGSTAVDAQSQISKARGLAANGDLEGAIKQAERAKQIVAQLDQNGQESAFVLRFLAKEIAQVQDAAAKGLVAESEKAIEAERARAGEIQQLITETIAKAEFLKQITVGFDQVGAEANADQLRAALEAKLAKNPIVIPVVTIDTGAKTSEDPAVAQLLGDVPKRAYGGPLPGTNRGDRSDHMIYRGTPGEWVIQRTAVRKWGDANMRLINAGRMPRYAFGGEIGKPSIASRVSIPGVDSARNASLVPSTLVVPGVGSFPIHSSPDIEGQMAKLFRTAALKRGGRR